MNKKAGVPDGIFYVVAIFAVAIISIVGYMTLNNINTNIQASSGMSTQGKNLMSDLTGKYVGIVDASFLLIFVGVLIGTIIGVWLIRVHPALFWVMIPIFAFIIFLGAIYANVFWNFTQNENITASSEAFTIIPFILKNYAYVITGVIVLIAIALFAKGKADTI